MTVVHNNFSWREKAALVLQHCGRSIQKKHFKRSDIPKIRRMANAGHTKGNVIETLKLDMTEAVFTARCKELRIRFISRSRIGHI